MTVTPVAPAPDLGLTAHPAGTSRLHPSPPPRGRHRLARRAGPAPLYRPLRLVLTPPLRLLYRLRVEGAEYVPASGPAVIAPNHRSFMDSLFVALALRRRVTFVAKAEYFESRRTRWFFRGTGQIPLRRGSGPAAERALEAAAGVLAGGGLVAIYPEGTRSRDGRLGRGQTGPARLAARAGVPIVPVGLVGTEEVQPVGRLLPRPFRRVTVRFGPSLAGLGERGHDRLGLRSVTDQLMEEIAGLCGQEPARRPVPAT